MEETETKGTELFANIYEEAKKNEEAICNFAKKLTPSQVRQMACVMEEVSKAGIGQNVDEKLAKSFEICGISPAIITHKLIESIGEKITPPDYLEQQMKAKPYIKDKKIFFINPFSLKNCIVKGKKLECDF